MYWWIHISISPHWNIRAKIVIWNFSTFMHLPEKVFYFVKNRFSALHFRIVNLLSRCVFTFSKVHDVISYEIYNSYHRRNKFHSLLLCCTMSKVLANILTCLNSVDIFANKRVARTSKTPFVNKLHLGQTWIKTGLSCTSTLKCGLPIKIIRGN